MREVQHYTHFTAGETEAQGGFCLFFNLFGFVYGFLCCAKDFKFNQISFVYIFITLGGGSKKSCCALCQRVFC